MERDQAGFEHLNGFFDCNMHLPLLKWHQAIADNLLERREDDGSI